MAFDPSSDYLLFDGLEPFTLRQGADDPVTVNNCQRGKLSYREIQFGAAMGVQPGDVVVTCWAPELGGLTPAAGDVFTDSNNTTYTVQATDYSAILGKHRCFVRKGVGNAQ